MWMNQNQGQAAETTPHISVSFFNAYWLRFSRETVYTCKICIKNITHSVSEEVSVPLCWPVSSLSPSLPVSSCVSAHRCGSCFWCHCHCRPWWWTCRSLWCRWRRSWNNLTKSVTAWSCCCCPSCSRIEQLGYSMCVCFFFFCSAELALFSNSGCPWTVIYMFVCVFM